VGTEPFSAVILAGGRGSRLFPFTASLPKPLLPIGEQTVIDLIIRRLVGFEVRRITVAVNYLADLVESFLGNGSRFGVPIDYVRETMPLGTAGPVGLVEPWTGPLVVTNGDVLADIDIQKLLKYHRENKATITVATMVQSVRIESGVITTDSARRITDIVEKPSVKHRISLGVYVLSEEVAGLITANERLEMPDLVMKVVTAGKAAVAYNHEGFWLDIGLPEDFAKAQADAAMWSERLRYRGDLAEDGGASVLRTAK
jgi:NDP-sugar pyrophosphorylase family protein